MWISSINYTQLVIIYFSNLGKDSKWIEFNLIQWRGVSWDNLNSVWIIVIKRWEFAIVKGWSGMLVWRMAKWCVSPKSRTNMWDISSNRSHSLTELHNSTGIIVLILIININAYMSIVIMLLLFCSWYTHA